MNYFELFEVKPGFEIDLTALAERYRQLQSRFHPDRFATAAANERLLAVQRASEINDGYQTLKSPLARAEYLLQLQGFDLKAEQQTLRDGPFLMQQMQWREQLEQLQHSPDPDANVSVLEAEFHAQLTLLTASFVAAYDDHQYPVAIDALRKLKFIDKLRTELDRLADKLFEF